MRMLREWHYESNYRHPNWSDDDWRWQFLRRRQDYREAFQKAVRELDFLPDVPSWAGDDTCPLTGATGVFGPYMHGIVWPFPHEAAHDFGLKEFFDPGQSDWQGYGPMWTWFTPWVPGLNCDGSEDEMEFIGFDLREPLKPQLDTAAAWLESMQEATLLCEDASRVGLDEAEADRRFKDRLRVPKRSRDKWPLYLRVLDARAEGASWREIAKILPESMGNKSPQAARNVHDQAKKQALRF